MDRFRQRQVELNNLVKGIKEDIKTMYKELGCNGYVVFYDYCKPKKFDAVCIHCDTLFFRDDDGYDYHSDNVNNVDDLLTILRAMHHLSAV